MITKPLRFTHIRPPRLGWLAALLYSSWPLAFMLNPAVGRHALASQLQAPHQPYNWLFVLLDVLTGTFVVAAGWIQWHTHKHWSVTATAVWGYVLFGIGAAIAALVPLDCDPESRASACGPILRDPTILIHGAMSILSVLGLLAGFVLVIVALYRAQAARHIQRWYAIIGLCWIGFGLGSLIELQLRIRDNNVLQDFFITVCSVSVAMTIAGLEYLGRRQRSAPVTTMQM